MAGSTARQQARSGHTQSTSQVGWADFFAHAEPILYPYV